MFSQAKVNVASIGIRQLQNRIKASGFSRDTGIQVNG